MSTHARLKSAVTLASVVNKVEGEFDKVVDSQNQTILIIDDEPANLAVVADYLAQSGLQIEEHTRPAYETGKSPPRSSVSTAARFVVTGSGAAGRRDPAGSDGEAALRPTPSPPH